MEKEIRMFTEPLEARNDEQHGNVIEGVPIVFGKETDLGFYREVIDPRALDQADLKDVRLLVNHDTNQLPLARSRNNNENSTMQMSVDADGMSIRVDLDTENNADARSLYSAVSRGDISGMSFMFSVDGDSWDEPNSEHPTRHICSIGRVMEVSAVTFPAYSATSIQTRGLSEALDGAKESLEGVRAEQLEIERRRMKLKMKLFNGGI